MLRLDRLAQNIRIADDNGYPTPEFIIWWQRMASQIENSVNGIEEAIQAAAAANSAAENAQAAADNAQTAASNAQGAADNTTETTSLANSYPDGAVLTATDAGADATITISSHTRVYGDGTSVAVDGGSVSGVAYSVSRFVYYDDPARAGGAVTYNISVSAPAQVGGRHVVGQVTTPAALAPMQPGRIVLPPGSGAISIL